jgi:CRISPR/Cas system CMR subunit Cmr6 (Cas7 group RAMP superfamily)
MTLPAAIRWCLSAIGLAVLFGVETGTQLESISSCVPVSTSLALNAGSSYQFGVASLSGDQTAARQGVCWLQGALIDLGVGAKSAAGYGYWILE